MIDVSAKGMFRPYQHELIIHFINESRSVGSLPKIKKYTLPAKGQDEATKQKFLQDLESRSVEQSVYYRKLKQQQWLKMGIS